MSVTNTSSGKRQRADNMRALAKSVGATINVPPGDVIFRKGEAGDRTYIVQAGVIDMVIGDKVIGTIGANEALGFVSMIDDRPRSSTAPAREACELSLIDPHLALHGGRGAGFRHLHRGRLGAAHLRHGSGDVSASRGRCPAAARRRARRSRPRW